MADESGLVDDIGQDEIQEIMSDAAAAPPPADDEPLPDGPTRATPQAKRLWLIPFAELRPSPEPAYLIKGLFPRTGLIVVWGPPKCGKSFWVTDAVLHAALGWEYRGHRVARGTVVYCAFEGQEGYGKRAEAFRRHHHLEKNAAVPFYLVAARFGLVRDHPGLIAAIKEQLGDIKPVAVVLDTLNRSIDGSESDDKDMTAYIKAADAIRDVFGCAVIIVHHCGTDATRPRGHTSLTGAVDAQIAVKRDVAGNIAVRVEWMKDGPEGETIVSKLKVVKMGTDADGEVITSCVVESAEGEAIRQTAKAKDLTPAAKVALAALAEALAEVGVKPPSSPHIPNTVARVVTSKQWREFAYRRGISNGSTDRARQKAFKDASDLLQERQRIGCWDDIMWMVSA